MPFVLVTPPAKEPITLQDAKDHLRVPHDADDDLIQALIAAARDHIETITHRVLMPQTWRYLRDGFPGYHPLYVRHGYPEFYIPKPPFKAMKSFQYVDVSGVTQTFAAPPDGYQLDPGGDTRPARVLPPFARPWPPTRMVPNNVILEFDCGYDDVPKVLVAALKVMLSHLYEHRGDDDQDIQIPSTVRALCLPYIAHDV